MRPTNPTITLPYNPNDSEIRNAKDLCRGDSLPVFSAIALYVSIVFLDNPELTQVVINGPDFRTTWDDEGNFTAEYIGQRTGCDQTTGVTFDRPPQFDEAAFLETQIENRIQGDRLPF